MGCALMQNGKFLAYASRKLNIHKKNNPTHDVVLEVMVFALKILRHYIYGVHVDLYTDHKILHYVFTQKELTSDNEVEGIVERLRHECSIPPRQD